MRMLLRWLRQRCEGRLGVRISLDVCLTASLLLTILTSVLINYHLLTSYESDTEHSLEDTNDHVVSNDHEPSISILPRERDSINNLLTDGFYDSTQITTSDWWMPSMARRWSRLIECMHEPDWAICDTVYSGECRVGTVNALYQFVSDVPGAEFVTGIEVVARAKLDDYGSDDAVGGGEGEERVSGVRQAGVLALVTMDGGRTHLINMSLTTSSQHDQHGHYILNSTTFTLTQPHQRIISVLIMLYCVGFEGSIKFADVSLQAKYLDFYEPPASDVSKSRCPPVTELHPAVTRGMLHVEPLIMADDSNIRNQHQLTIVTQLSLDRLQALHSLLSTWHGPLIACVYIGHNKDDGGRDGNVGERWENVYIRKQLTAYEKSKLLTVLIISNHFDAVDRNPALYPINTLRNLAIERVVTKYFINIDADFVTSPGFAKEFSTLLSSGSAVMERLAGGGDVALVVPAFEYLEPPPVLPLSGAAESFPGNKSALVAEVSGDNPNLVPFRFSESVESHHWTQYERWYKVDQVYEVDLFHDKYEPYVILAARRGRSEGKVASNERPPAYSEAFSEYGMNKVTHVLELRAAGYEFHVAPSMWLIHQPHRPSQHETHFLQDPGARVSNRQRRFNFINNLINKYHLQPCGAR